MKKLKNTESAQLWVEAAESIDRYCENLLHETRSWAFGVWGSEMPFKIHFLVDKDKLFLGKAH